MQPAAAARGTAPAHATAAVAAAAVAAAEPAPAELGEPSAPRAPLSKKGFEVGRAGFRSTRRRKSTKTGERV